MIFDVNSIDLIAKKKDGGVDLFIISSGEIDASDETQKLLLNKVERYLGYIQSEEFKKEFSDSEAKEITIIFELEEKPPAPLLELCKKIIPWAEENGAQFLVRCKEKTNKFYRQSLC